MKNTFKVVSIAFAAILAISTAACGGGKSINSPEALKAYLDSKPANSPDKPIKVTINANDQMLREISRIIERTGKYVSLTLSGNALTTIPGFSFNDSASLITSITIPNGVTSIGGQAFHGCIFTSITIPASVTSIGENSFSWCRNLTSVTFAPTSKVTIIEDEAFAECSSLASVTIPDSVNSIGRAAFRGCTSLASVTIPKSGTSIGRYAFLGDLQIKYIAGGIGTYKTNAPVGDSSVWTKQGSNSGSGGGNENSNNNKIKENGDLSESPNKVDKSLNGTWVGEDNIITFNNGKCEVSSKEGNTLETFTYTASNGKMSIINPDNDVDRMDHNYSIKGKTLTIISGGGNTMVYTLK